MNKRKMKKKLNFKWQCEAVCGCVTSYSNFRKTLRNEHALSIQHDRIYKLITSHNSGDKMRYRYVMCGMFIPTDREIYEIEIPSPCSYRSEEAAMRDERFGYRFALVDKSVGPQIFIFAKENFKISSENDKKCLLQWVEGNILGTYTFEEFKKAGGKIRMLKPELKGCGFIDSNTDFLDTNKTFKDIFPNMQRHKLYYVDNEAYYIKSETIVN